MSFDQSFDNREGFIWFNGEFQQWNDSKIHVLNHGLHYASCVFEGLRFYDGKPFKLTEHSERLIKSAEIIDMQIPYSATQIDDFIWQSLEKNNLTNTKKGYIRPVAWRGSEMLAIAAQKTSINLAIAVWESKTYFSEEKLRDGITLVTSSWRRPPANSAPVHSKAAGLYMICTMSKHQALNSGYDDALMLDSNGDIAEATGANIFLIFNGELHTPIPDCFLDGITRRTVMELAENKGIKVVERKITTAELSQASEVFLTGTAAEITPVRSIDDHTFSLTDITRGLQQDYQDLVYGRN